LHVLRYEIYCKYDFNDSADNVFFSCYWRTL